MNIAPDVLKAGLEAGLEAMATGGGMDYLFKDFGETGLASIVGREGDGSPETLDEPAIIVIHLDEEWQTMIQVPCTSTREAISTLVEMSAINC
jgi:hypothetical protein